MDSPAVLPMAPIRMLQARNTISRQKQRLQQELVFLMTVENIAWDKLVEVQWTGEDGVWRTLRAEYYRPGGENREIWRARATFNPAEDASLPGDIEFSLHYRVLGEDYWDNNHSRNFVSYADSGVMLDRHAQLQNVDFNPLLKTGQRVYPITVAVGQSLKPRQVRVHWTTDNWRSTQVTPCFFRKMRWDKARGSRPRNPNRYDTSLWSGQIKVGDAFRVEYAIACETDAGTVWDNNFGQNYLARRQRLKILTLNLHCYQEENQDAKFSHIARAIDDLDIDVVCLQEVAENWGEGMGDWNSNSARIIRDRLRRHYHLHTDWSHLGFDRYREGVAILSKFDFITTDAGYVSSNHDIYSINSRKVVLVRVDVPYMGVVNVFSAHLSWLSGGFLEQFENLRGWANQQHGGHLAASFLCGDFNIKAGEEGYQAVVRTQEYEDQFLAATSRRVFDKVFRQASPNIARELAADGRIDYIFMQKHSSLRAASGSELFTDHDRYGRVSDHVGYLVEFEPNW